MAEIFDFYVADNRTIKFNPIEPILQEDNRVAVWRFRIPKMLNNIDMSGFAWWFVYINAAKQKYSEPLTLTADADDPDNYCIADYTIDYGISLTPGSFTFALEAINANGSGDIVEEWHTKTYSHSVIGTLQGNQAEYSETESDIISALMVQIQEKYNALVGGATPIPVASISAMTDTSKIYLLTTDNNWYCYNGSTWVSGGQYASGIVIDPTLTQSGQAADAKATGDRLHNVEDELGVNLPDVYTGTITQPNVNAIIADNLSFERSTQYKYTFSIQSAINTNVYVYLNRGGESDSTLFSGTIATGETSVVKLYTTSGSYDITEGYIRAAANATGVTVMVAIEPAEGVPTRLDEIETDVTAHGTAIDGLTSRTTVLEAEVAGIDVSVNRLNPFTVTTGKYINMSGASGNDTRFLYTDYIKVNPGEMVYLVNDGVCDGNTRFRYLTAYDSEKVVIPASGKETSYRYDVPEGVSYIILTLYATDYNGGKLAVNVDGIFPYTAYNDAAGVVNYAQRLKMYPYTTLPDYVLGGAWYKPLGSLSKGYFCFVTDDGRIGMNEYTIPTLVIGKSVKCTFAIMSNSEVMADAEKIAVVKDAVDNYGCSVAQHGGTRWTDFNEYGLNNFFDTEKTFFDSIGIEVRGAVIPEHYNSQLIYAVAGGKYGVVRSGYDGHIYPTVCPYENYSNGPRSNLYGLTSYNIVDSTLASNKAAVDSALANHRLMIVYIHENSLDNAKKAVIEGLMDYVNETGITQITLGDIPNII